MKRLLVVIAASIPLTGFGEGGLPNQPYIYVEGKAEIKKPADAATLRFNLIGRSPDQVKANADVEARATKAFVLIRDRKISDSDIIAQEIRSEPQFEEDQAGRSSGKVIGYTVTRSFDIKIRDLRVFPNLVEDLNTIGAEFTNVDEELSNQQEMTNELWSKALSDARDRGEKIATAAGLKIESVFAVSPEPFPRLAYQMFGENSHPTANELGPPPKVVPEYKFAPVTMTQQVHVIYLISPAK